MTKDQVKEILDCVLTWPEEDQEKVARFVQQLEASREDDISEQEWRLIEESAARRDLATDEEVESAIQAVGAWELLSVLPGGFEHEVEEEGHNLTAAQRQLVALARAWLAKPDILVLDEATSLLDTAVEDQIIEALHELNCTTLMITHRETVAAKSDFIVVLEAGRVVDSGPEEQVARPGGPYDRLWRVQEDELADEKDRELAGTSET